MHCLQLEKRSRALASTPLQTQLPDSRPPAVGKISTNTTMELVNASANSVNDAPAQGSNDGTGKRTAAWQHAMD